MESNGDRGPPCGHLTLTPLPGPGLLLLCSKLSFIPSKRTLVIVKPKSMCINKKNRSSIYERYLSNPILCAFVSKRDFMRQGSVQLFNSCAAMRCVCFVPCYFFFYLTAALVITAIGAFDISSTPSCNLIKVGSCGLGYATPCQNWEMTAVCVGR